MSNNLTGNKMSFKDILVMLFIPFQPLMGVTKDSRAMQTGLIIATVIVYLIPIIFYIATKNILISLVPWLIVVWVIKRIGDEFPRPK